MNVKLKLLMLILILLGYNLALSWSTPSYCPFENNPLIDKNDFYLTLGTLPEKNHKKTLRTIWQIDFVKLKEEWSCFFKLNCSNKKIISSDFTTRIIEFNFVHTGISPPLITA